MWKWIERIVIGIAVVMLLLKGADWLAHRGTSLPPVPQPNGYEALLAAAKVAHTPEGDLADLGAEAVQRIAETNRAVLEKVHAAVRTETAVPLETGRGWADRHAEDVKRLKRLAIALGVQAKAASLEGKTDTAAQCLLDNVLLGQAMARGGHFLDAVSGLAVEAIGAAALRTQVPQLDAGFCRAAARELEQAERRRELPERILRTEAQWSHASFGLASRLGGLAMRKSLAERGTEFTKRYHEGTRRTRQLILALAARAFELENGKRPTAPAELVPGILQAVPLDPVSQKVFTQVPSTTVPGGEAPRVKSG